MQYFRAAVGANSQAGTGVTATSQWDRLNQFLILGDETGIYHAGGPQFSVERAGVLRQCLVDDGPRAVQAIAAMRGSGRAPKSDPGLWSLAVAASPAHADAGTNRAALESLPEAARSSRELKKFVSFVTAERGWGRSLRAAIGRWYLEKPVRQLALQMVRERGRSRWSHADLLRLSHPKPSTRAQAMLFRWAVEGELGHAPSELLESDLKPIQGYELARRASDKHALIGLIEDYQLTQEMIPERWLGSFEVWQALLDSMPYCAMLRNLTKLTALGLIAPQGETTALVAARLVDHRRIERAKVHPVTLLQALLDYRDRHDVPAIVSALEAAYYASFTNVTASGRRIGLQLDAAALVPSTAMAMLSARSEPGGESLKNHRLDAVMDAVRDMPTAGADFGVEALVVVTAGREWTPRERPAGVPVVVIAPHATAPVVTGADDPLLLQVIGFNASVPPVVADFVRHSL